ncbi:hypothetical protein HYV50_05535 [Candidatus Pacearchaeota archaeon]|nr:hypothetical protein [Candidatus Pacearchaeota archaeon]
MMSEILTANTFFLLIVFIVLIIIHVKNGNSKKESKKIKEDIKKIKEHIVGE